MRILLVEDERELARMIAAALVRNDAVVDSVTSLQSAQEAVIDDVHDVVILDRGLPDGDGLDLVPWMRARQLRAGVLVLTALADVPDRVASLDGGADDMLAKPFATDELLARVRALARRPSAQSPQAICVGALRYDVRAREASLDGEALVLPRRELLVLEALIERNGRVVRREDLQDRVYGYDEGIQSNTLDAHVSRLRTKVERAGLKIHAIRGLGYLLSAEA